MKVVVAIDSFKGSLSSAEAGAACREGILRADPDAQVLVYRAADGGEGTLEVFMGLGMEWKSVSVTGPLGEKVDSGYCADKSRAFVEMARAAGLTMVPEERRNPLDTTTFGVGELIMDAAEGGCRDIYLCIGGSATGDCGLGMLTAMGWRFLDGEGRQCGVAGRDLARVAAIGGGAEKLAGVKFHVACDVNNPLCGENGAAAVYGPQKGASPEDVGFMDAAAERFSKVCAEYFGRDASALAGAGAAGGMGYALAEFLDAELIPGAELVLQAGGIEKDLPGADYAVTGEGRLDSQSVMGKVPVGVAKLAGKYGVPTIAIAGCAAESAKICNDHGIAAYFPIPAGACTLEEAMDKKTAAQNLSRTAEQVFRLLKIKK
jgi:glycerate kinase